MYIVQEDYDDELEAQETASTEKYAEEHRTAIESEICRMKINMKIPMKSNKRWRNNDTALTTTVCCMSRGDAKTAAGP